MLFCPLGDHRDNMAYAQLRQLFQRPLHAVEFENGKVDRNLRQGGSFNFRAKLKLNLVMRGKDHFGGTEHAIGGDIEFLLYFYAENAKEMVGARSQQKS